MNSILKYRNVLSINAFHQLVFVLSLLFPVNFFAQEIPMRFEQLTVSEGLLQNTIQGIIKDKYGFIWMGTWSGLCKYDGYKFYTYIPEANNPKSILAKRIRLLYKDNNQDIWISFSSDTLFCRYNYATDDFTRFLPRQVKQPIRDSLNRNKNISHTFVNTPQYYWKIDQLTNELIQKNKHTNVSRLMQVDPFRKWGLNDLQVNDLYKDDNDILWIGTFNGGINKTDLRAKPFRYYYHNPENSQSLIDDVIRPVFEDKDGNLWVGTQSFGISKINRKNNTYTQYQHNVNNQNSLTDNRIRCIHEDKTGFIWIGTKSGIDRFNPKTNSFFHFGSISKNKVLTDAIFCIYEDRSGNLWIGGANGIAKYDIKNDKISYFDSRLLLKRPYARIILEDSNHNLWVGSEGNGLLKFKLTVTGELSNNLKPKAYVNSINDPHSLSDNQIYAMLEDKNGYLWVGTSAGLNRFDPKTGTFLRFGKKEGLPDEMIMGILSDNHGHLWISHKKGLTRFDIKNYRMRNFNRFDGLQGDEFTENAFFRSPRTGEMFFGGTNGLNSFFPEQIKDNPFIPRIYITDLKIMYKSVHLNETIDNRVVLTHPIYQTHEIILTHNDKNIALEFAALHFSNPESNRYAYMLEGFDKEWIYTNASNRIATYSNLTPNTYIFKVKASNCDGVWNENPATLKIIVLPPWWKTTMAYITYLIIIILTIYYIYKYLASRQNLKNQILIERLNAEKLRELDEMKMQFFTSVSHEFRTPLSLIIDPLEKIAKDDLSQTQFKNYGTMMLRNARRLLRLINQLLDYRKLEAGHLKLETSRNDIIDFIKSVAEAFTYDARQRNISYQVQIPNGEFQTAFDPDKLEKILYNLISNAFKYTADSGEIRVNVTIPENESPEDFIEIKIQDSGVGIPKESMNKIFDIFYQVEGAKRYEYGNSGIGLALTKELVELLRGTITVESEPGKGSCFTLRLPLLSPTMQSTNQTFTIADKPEQPPITSTQETPTAKNAPRLLLVEDNEDIRAYLKSELQNNYRIIESSNGLQGLQHANEYIPDLIVSDIMMPEMNGLEMCSKIKTNEPTSHIPVILLTSRQSPELQVEGYETGADAYITKPFSTAILQAQIKNLIEARNKLRNLFGKDSNFDPKKIAVNITDEAFINKAIGIVEHHLSDTEFDTDAFAKGLKMGRTQLNLKIKALTNQTPHDFITTIRMNKASELLLSGEYSISEVAYMIGYSLPSNFSRSFMKQFGLRPKEYIASHKNQE